MGKQLGRLLLIQMPDPDNAGQFKNLCGFRSQNFAVSNSMVDETGLICNEPEKAPTRERAYGIQDTTFSGSGRYDDDAEGKVLAIAALNQTVLEGYRVVVPGFGSLTGNFTISDYTFSGEEEGSMTFSATIGQESRLTFAEL